MCSSDLNSSLHIAAVAFNRTICSFASIISFAGVHEAIQIVVKIEVDNKDKNFILTCVVLIIIIRFWSQCFINRK